MVYTLRRSTGSITGLDTSFRGDTKGFLYRKTAIVGRGVRLSFMHLFFSSPSAMSSPLLSFRRYLPTVTERKYLVSISPASPSYYIRSLSPATRGLHQLSEAVRPASGQSSPTS